MFSWCISIFICRIFVKLIQERITAFVLFQISHPIRKHFCIITSQSSYPRIWLNFIFITPLLSLPVSIRFIFFFHLLLSTCSMINVLFKYTLFVVFESKLVQFLIGRTFCVFYQLALSNVPMEKSLLVHIFPLISIVLRWLKWINSGSVYLAIYFNTCTSTIWSSIIPYVRVCFTISLYNYLLYRFLVVVVLLWLDHLYLLATTLVRFFSFVVWLVAWYVYGSDIWFQRILLSMIPLLFIGILVQVGLIQALPIIKSSIVFLIWHDVQLSAWLGSMHLHALIYCLGPLLVIIVFMINWLNRFMMILCTGAIVLWMTTSFFPCDCLV